MVASIPALLGAVRGADSKVPSPALREVDEQARPAELPAALDLLRHLKESQELDPARQALSDVCSKDGNPQSHASKRVSLLPKTQPAQKIVLLGVLSPIGGANAPRAVWQTVNDREGQVRTAAIGALGAWKTADVVNNVPLA